MLCLSKMELNLRLQSRNNIELDMKFVKMIIQSQIWRQKNTLGWNVQFLTFAYSKCVNAFKYDFSHDLKIPSHFLYILSFFIVHFNLCMLFSIE